MTYYQLMVQKRSAAAPSAPQVAPVPVHLPSLITFEAVARHLNFSRAAAELEVTPTAISKTVKLLEAQMGVRLFHPTTRSVALSEPGALLLSTLGPALEQMRQSLTHVGGTFTLGRLGHRRHVTDASLIEPHLESFLERYPQINLEVSLDNALSDIVANGFDAGIRLGHALQRDMVAVPLGPVQRRLVVASPEYLAAHSVPESPQELLNYGCIRQRLAGKGRFFEWVFQHKKQSLTVDVRGRRF